MTIEGTLAPNHIQVNKYKFDVPGLPPLRIVGIGALEKELDTSEAPDRTPNSGGRTKPLEFDITVPLHEELTVAAFSDWFTEAEGPKISPTHKKTPVLSLLRQDGTVGRSYVIELAFPFKEALPDLEEDNEGEMAMGVWSMKASGFHKVI